jgi:hypothetical protein
MIEINKSDIDRISTFILDNELDYDIINNGIIRYHIKSHDNIIFYFYNYNDNFVVVKYDKTKDGKPGQQPYEYYQFKNLQQVLQELKIYDESLYKQWWYPTINSAEIGFNKEGYNDNWIDDFKGDEFWSVDSCDTYNYLVYNNTNISPNIKSPFNTLHEVSPINDIQLTKVNKLYFEIHPISCQSGNESYLLKLLCNNEEVLKEFINYIVSKKKGLKLLIKEIFDTINNSHN